MINKNIVILGASNKPQRYSNKAQVKLAKHGYEVFPVSRDVEEINGVMSVTSLLDIEVPIDTVTVYLRPEILTTIMDELIELSPRRVIFNPGTESGILADQLVEADIEITEACTLVLLSTNQFED